jgi:hypothetical protein
MNSYIEISSGIYETNINSNFKNDTRSNFNTDRLGDLTKKKKKYYILLLKFGYSIKSG